VKRAAVLISTVSMLGAVACSSSTPPAQTAMPVRYEPVDQPGALARQGVESQDIEAMADEMVRDLLATPQLMNRAKPPLIVVDSEFFENRSSQRLDKNLVTDRLRVKLNRASGGRLVFLGRHQAEMVQQEAKLEQTGNVTAGSYGPTSKVLGWDYRLGGRIMNQDAVQTATAIKSSYFQITFELIERGTSIMIWTNQYVFKKTAQDDVVYR
jgi:PBP1b-binding outer membrane lipoprotein LpoB